MDQALTDGTRESAAARVTRSLRSLAGAAWHLPERILHGTRRSAARRSVARRAPVRSALFICHGNVCRSPFAAAVFARAVRDRLGAEVTVSSAGFVGPGRQPPATALDAARRRGIDMTDHRSALITQQSLSAADLVVVMAAEQSAALMQTLGNARPTVVVLGDLDPQPIVRRTIRDPWGGDGAVFDESYARVERCVADLVAVLASAAR